MSLWQMFKALRQMLSTTQQPIHPISPQTSTPTLDQQESDMPLIKSSSKESIGKNIKAELAVGKPKRKAIALALQTAREKGAKIPKRKIVKKDK